VDGCDIAHYGTKERLAFLLAAIAFASALSLVVYSEVLPLLLDISATLDAVR
jgi:hypothetical protein